MDIASILEQLNRGELPDALNFAPREKEPDDWELIRKLTFDPRPVYEGRFELISQIPGFDSIIDMMVDKTGSPLEEMVKKSLDTCIDERETENDNTTGEGESV